MKLHAGIFILIAFIQPTLAQNFEGVYKGDLFSKNNFLALRVKKEAASGVLFTNASDKYIFQGVIKGRELTGTLNNSSVMWNLKGILVGDSLSLMISSGQATSQAVLLKISSNPKTNVPDLIESFSRDKQLIGTWLYVKAENLDGSPKKIDERFVGAIRHFESNGTYDDEFPFLERQLKSLPPSSSSYSKPRFSWSTKDSKLTFTPSKFAPTPYEIRNDTLIITEQKQKNFYLRRKKV
jgi:hypothetical protein